MIKTPALSKIKPKFDRFKPMKLHELYRKELVSGEAIRKMIDRNQGVTVSIHEVQSETLSKFLDAIEALEMIINHPLSEKAWLAGQTALQNLEVP
jgi:ribosome maturation factor RimP